VRAAGSSRLEGRCAKEDVPKEKLAVFEFVSPTWQKRASARQDHWATLTLVTPPAAATIPKAPPAAYHYRQAPGTAAKPPIRAAEAREIDEHQWA
jgi:hypothetical protein